MTALISKHRLLLGCLCAAAGGGVGWLTGSAVVGATVLAVNLLLCWLTRFILGKTIDASSTEVLPFYFHSALDGLSEGILVLDYAGQIVFVNNAFLEFSGESREGLLQRRAKELPWTWCDAVPGTASTPVPWLDAIREGRHRCGQLLGIKSGAGHKLLLKAVPITDGKRRPRGALCSLQDVTKLHKKQAETEALLETIRQSSQQIRQQNAELEQLIIRDPATGCLNRRTGLELLEKLWSESLDRQSELACVMVDIDRFRAINDEHGQQLGEKVLRDIAACILQAARAGDVVCRYGGEEFLMLMPRTTLDDAAFLAERIRQSISRLEIDEIKVTASFGVAEWNPEQVSPQDLLDLAERHLSAAKQRGRNQVVKSLPEKGVQASPLVSAVESSHSAVIPFPAVTALISALAYRDIATAAHSRRVADLSVALGQRLMSLSACYVLETAALLHDIGKIGVPDSILLKQTPLTADERNFIQNYSHIGLEIVRTAFASPELSAILENARVAYADSLARQQSLPLGARILAVADAYDSMINDQIYRKGVSPAEAIAELRRCAGTQFDPEIVTQFIEVVLSKTKETGPKLQVNLDVALALGMELERLAEAVDQQNMELLRALASHIVRTASSTDTQEILDKALEFERAAVAGDDQLGILQKASELITCCRATQSAYLRVEGSSVSSVEGPEPAAKLSVER
ncbi:diguanylate cyclase [Planctomicrobium piriforme]|uniref:diguanylate cyclase n=1 Tax=Planctomicrobium piriforme TaxID=1576369 RepID=A0A1I3BK70_9PLAN|nr:diguanylate cyclase [Planctomicrobium piriforme]SFH62496.1 PAS domain S-box-containing protein/diguanylate cyclase (GGDEF) domain-containing protein [Planctomicrobium piriforme]